MLLPFQRRDIARRRESVRRINDPWTPDHHLTTAELKCRQSVDEEPDLRDGPVLYVGVQCALPYREIKPIHLVKLHDGRVGCWQNKFYPTGVGEEGTHPDKWKKHKFLKLGKNGLPF